MYVNVRMPDGTVHRLEALEGWRVMEVIRDWGLPIKAECGGACACATCHVTVDPNWVGKLHPANDDEEAMLDGLPQVEPTSRLSCQLIFSEALNVLAVSIAPAA
jgi:2Fe-2S ferredoxin